eukprot:TRINITY_DN2292_c0_g1_i2.p3 TRINITY_DN2292_c0_g1~~TRINITY_DN2292_c0_g1_i2.p3  ORF type:complete len:100 (-),score=31.87 TRINITY_DN2292_c0_g1_i2:183-482(-)
MPLLDSSSSNKTRVPASVAAPSAKAVQLSSTGAFLPPPSTNRRQRRRGGAAKPATTTTPPPALHSDPFSDDAISSNPIPNVSPAAPQAVSHDDIDDVFA